MTTRTPKRPRAEASAGLTPAEERERCREAALRLLDVRDRTTAELTQRLRQKGFDPDVIAGVVESLVRAELLDDRRFAERFAEHAAQSRGMAGSRIRLELAARGIDRETAAAVSAEPPEAEIDRAETLVKRRRRALESLDPPTRYRRVVGMLARRGYSADVADAVARRAADGESSAER